MFTVQIQNSAPKTALKIGILKYFPTVITISDYDCSCIKLYRIDVKFRYGRRFRRTLVEFGHMQALREGNFGDQQEDEAVLHDAVEFVFKLRT